MTDRPRHAGPPLAGVAGACAALTVGALLVGVVAAGRVAPTPFASTATVLSYLRGHRLAGTLVAFLTLGSAVPLAVYAATASSRLHHLGVRAAGATIALAGGLVAAVALAVSAACTWVLTRPAVLGDATLVRAVHDLAFATGGPAFAAGLGLLLAGVAIPAGVFRLVPRRLALAGLTIAALAEVSTLTLVVAGAWPLLPIVRAAGLVWLILVGRLLPVRRAAVAVAS